MNVVTRSDTLKTTIAIAVAICFCVIAAACSNEPRFSEPIKFPVTDPVDIGWSKDGSFVVQALTTDTLIPTAGRIVRLTFDNSVEDFTLDTISEPIRVEEDESVEICHHDDMFASSQAEIWLAYACVKFQKTTGDELLETGFIRSGTEGHDLTGSNIFTVNSLVQTFAISPDSGSIALYVDSHNGITAEKSLKVESIEATKPTKELLNIDDFLPNESIVSITWSPDGDRLAVLSSVVDPNGAGITFGASDVPTASTGKIRLFSINSDAYSGRILLNELRTPRKIQWAPTGDLIALGLHESESNQSVVLVNSDSGETREISALGSIFSWSPNGEQLGVLGSEGLVRKLFFISVE